MEDIEIGRYAIRTFDLNFGDIRSVSGNPGHWVDGVCKAECTTLHHIWDDLLGIFVNKTAIHPAPDPDCACGVYGALSLEGLQRQYRSFAEDVVAVMAAEGTTIIGNRGLRTECARIVAYWSRRNCRKVCREGFPDAKRYRFLRNMLLDYNIPVKRPKT